MIDCFLHRIQVHEVQVLNQFDQKKEEKKSLILKENKYAETSISWKRSWKKFNSYFNLPLLA